MAATAAVNFPTENTSETINLQTVYRDRHKNHFTVLSNKTLRTRVPGDPLTAEHIWHDALTCEKTFKITTKTLAKRHGVSEKVIIERCTRLRKFGVADSVQFRDPATKRFGEARWVFYETPREPQPENGGYGSNDEKPHGCKESIEKSRNPQNGVTALYIDQDIKKKQHIEETTTPPPEPPTESQPQKPDKPPAQNGPAGPVVDVLKVRKMLDPKIAMRLDDKTIKKRCLGKSEARIKAASEQAMRPGIANRVGYFLKMIEVPMFEENEIGLSEVPLPAVKVDPGDSWEVWQEKQKRFDIVACYNRSVHKPCSYMRALNRPNGNCMKYCPYVKSRL